MSWKRPFSPESATKVAKSLGREEEINEKYSGVREK